MPLLPLVLLLLALLPLPQPALADDPEAAAAERALGVEEAQRPGRTGLPLPRFVSLRSSEVNLRTGPGFRYPIEWVYRRSGQPVEVVDEFDTWRRIRDWEGTSGWVHQSMLQGRRTVRVTESEQLLRREPSPSAPPVARLAPGAIGGLNNCRDGWCRLDFSGFVGWLPRETFYGVYAEEMLE